MRILGFARRLKDVRAVVQTLRDRGIKITGPYRTPKGTIIYTRASTYPIECQT